MQEQNENLVKSEKITVDTDQKTDVYYVSLLQKYFIDPSSLSEEEFEDLRGSKYLNRLSSSLDKFIIKTIEPKETEDLKNLELAIQDRLKTIGSLEVEKQFVIKDLLELEEKKTAIINAIGIRYRIPKEVSFTVDISTGEIKMDKRYEPPK